MGVPNIELIMKTPLLEMVIIMQVPLSISSIARRPSRACVCVRSGQETRLMMGVSNIELILKTPLLEMVKVPLSMSSMAMRPCIMSLCVCVCVCVYVCVSVEEVRSHVRMSTECMNKLASSYRIRL